MKISDLLADIRKKDLVLPEFQREYVWKKEQAKQLMVSLVRGYPVGGLLIWKTESPPELKNVAKLPDKLGTVQVLLDGQQRLTTLHMLIEGEIPAYYTEAEIESDPRDLFVNLNTLDFQYYQSSKMAGDPYWQRVTDCFDSTANIQPLRIAQAKSDGDGMDPLELGQRLMDHLTKVRQIKEADLPLQVVPVEATLTEAIDIFDRVNSQGTKLTDAELALTHVVAKWPAARRELKSKMDSCEKDGLHFGLTFMTRALTVAVTRRALFEVIHDRPRGELEAGWANVNKVLDYLITILRQKFFIHSTDDLNSSNALIPLISYLSLNGGHFPNEQAIRHATNWLYSALTWARYTAQTDQRLEADVQLVVRESEPWDALRSNIVDQRGRIEVKDVDFEGRGAQHPLYKMAFILAKAHGAADWLNGLPLGDTKGKSYSLHSHHIFPTSLLYKNGWDADNYTHRQAVNEIANRAFLTADSNWSYSSKRPSDYLPEIESKFPGALAAQFVPMEPDLWKFENYGDFLSARRKMIARKLNEYMDSLISQPEETRRRPITELIDLGESYVLEFKSTLQWDVIQGQQNKTLRTACLKTIAAFMNSEGGTLIVGVEDDGSLFGLERDFKLVGNSADKFEQLFVSLIKDGMGSMCSPYYRIRFEEAEAKTVCIVDTERSPEPVFLKTEKGKEFFIRAGNTTRSLDNEETHRYIETNW